MGRMVFPRCVFPGTAATILTRSKTFRSSGEAIPCFGDNLTEGVGASEGEKYPSLLSRQLAMPVLNAGRRGDTTAQGLKRIALSKNQDL
jgi:lysophospholipase L1-like esterase